MGEFFSEYGLFLLELLTVVILVVGAVIIIAATARRQSETETLTVHHLNEDIERKADVLRRAVLDKHDFKKAAKLRAREKKREKRRTSEAAAPRKRIFVIDFKGDIRASATASLREEISAVLAVAEDGDEALVRLENAGGTVHEHGLAASQLLRLKTHGLPLTIAVDKVAASGGYLMACVADRLVAAPFAIIGSIGVIAQLPNFHRLLEEKGIDFEQVMAGKFKRTLTFFGENTDEAREKLKEELDEVHRLFKHEIGVHRPQVDLERIATGEHWYGVKALELELIDEITTSDDYLLNAASDHDIYSVAYKRRRTLPERLMSGAETLLSR
jgi:serine protease SohB